MPVWFEDLPLDWTRHETRRSRALLSAAYSTNVAAIGLAQDAGLDTTKLRHDQEVEVLIPEILKQARLSNRLPQLLAVVLSDSSREAVHDELWAHAKGAEDRIIAAALRQKPSLETLAQLPSSIEVRTREGSHPIDRHFEKVINEVAGFADPAVFRRRLVEAELRTARIDIDGAPSGTGFLIGPDLLLTNWHVVSGAGNGVAVFDNKVSVAARTEAAAGRGISFAEHWLIAKSPHDTSTNEFSADGPPAGFFDFAVVRLSEAIGNQTIGSNPSAGPADTRGWYGLDDRLYSFEEREPIFIVGHPDGKPMQFSYASPSGCRPTANRNRVRYQTNTEAGSSGSPVFNREWRVVALHHAAGPTTKPGDFNRRTDDFNQGVPISAIAAELKAQLRGRAELVQLGLARLLEAPEPRPDSGLDAFQRLHLQVLLEKISFLDVPGIPKSVRLEKIWIRPSFVQAEQGLTSLHKILAGRAVAIEAPAGFGKTTLSKIIAVSLARDFLKEPCSGDQSWQSLYLGVNAGKHGHFPVLTDLRFVEKLDEIESLIRYASPTVRDADMRYFAPLLESGSVVFVLDGLDEVEPARRSRLIELILKARQVWKQCYFLVTSRNYEAQALAGGGFDLIRMCSLSRREINELAAKWAAVITADNGRSGADFLEAMDKLLGQERADQPFISSPLVVAFLASIYIGTGNIPENRSRLFAQVANWLLNSRSAIRESLNVDLRTTKVALEALAFSFVNGSVRSGATADSAAAAAAQLAGLDPSAVDKALKIEAAESNCLVMSDGSLGFWHESIRDYFAACWLARRFHDARETVPPEMDAILYDARFREIADLLIALLAAGDGEALRILLRVKNPVGEQSIENIRATSLLSRILKIGRSLGFKFTKSNEKQIDEAARKYLDLSESSLLAMSIPDRIEMLRAVGGLGKDARLYGPPVRRALATSSAEANLGKFPVTVQEYGRFLKEMLHDGNLGRSAGNSIVRFPLMWDAQQNTPNAPVTGVDWLQAEAYCRWLTSQMRSEQTASSKVVVRLPSLDEWCGMTAPSTGGKQAEKRWVGAFDEKFSTSVQPVGVYPERAGVHGHQDLSDGVWEWIGPSLLTKSRRKQIVSSAFSRGGHIPFWRRASGLLQSPVVGFRVLIRTSA